MAETKIKHDAVSELLNNQILAGIEKINKGNETLLAEESGTSVRDIDKALKAEAEKISKDETYTSEFPADVLKNFAEAQAAYEAYRKSVEAARNSYRVNVLGEEEKSGTLSDDEKDSLKDTRKVVMDAITLLKSYAAGNGRTDLVAYADSIQVPQVGRQGVSSVGQKKPRVFVKVNPGTENEKVYDSFSQAAAALSTKDVKVSVAELTEAWNEQTKATEGTFTHNGLTIGVTFKPKKSDEK